ncbi:hypothetical protein SAMN05192568_102735 [Methylobacterium pseudosasicola]|uniref:Uncharacterized protein n=1 Tax=Methylobacterium pseudosasicola TaxID=582667 RepID=A0A1I4PYH6_9HYPH|nr:hypothetical protein SAMN05192568_102735 [Methylobacterium pseudosasicola]
MRGGAQPFRRIGMPLRFRTSACPEADPRRGSHAGQAVAGPALGGDSRTRLLPWGEGSPASNPARTRTPTVTYRPRSQIGVTSSGRARKSRIHPRLHPDKSLTGMIFKARQELGRVRGYGPLSSTTYFSLQKSEWWQRVTRQLPKFYPQVSLSKGRTSPHAEARGTSSFLRSVPSSTCGPGIFRDALDADRPPNVPDVRPAAGSAISTRPARGAVPTRCRFESWTYALRPWSCDASASVLPT